MKVHLVRILNQGQQVSNMDANGTYVRRLFVAAYDKAKNSLGEEKSRTAKQQRIKDDDVPIPWLTEVR